MNIKNLRIFIAEDEAIIRTGFRLSVERMGHNVVGESSSGGKALDEIPLTNPDLILIDINMPDMNGLDAIQICRKKIDVPFIVITGHFTDGLLEKAGHLGAAAYLIKPIDDPQLKAAINIAIKRETEINNLYQENKELKSSLENRKLIERAKGIYMRQFQISEQEAMTRLQDVSRSRNQKLPLLAKEIIEASKLLEI